MIGNLGDREAGPMPQRTAYPLDSAGLNTYLDAWYLNHAIRRDAEPTDDERLVAFEVRMEYARRLFAERYGT